MTQFLPSYIPAEITTVEQLAVWCSEVLVYLYPNKSVVQALDENGDEISSRQIEANKYYYTAPAAPEWRYVISGCSLKLNQNHHVFGKVWEHVQPIGNDVIPTQMRKV